MWNPLRPRRVLRAIYRCLVAYGTFHTGPEPGGTVGALRDAAPGEPVGPLTGPVPGHPEQVCGDVPLTALERSLARELEAR
ncbi:DUF6059 family protein [Streptomyces sp. Tu 3180]|uniref:DUF6059 family protein n=1 Tax=Streptomyces sp. Tu 3180 TaxID=2682611 RepID=UPI00135C6BF6|nr:DUF6059 family protein [Streptomyces sp. Tu 3180]KAF3469400.1 hypothetical protein GL259_37620 [Streptomyces sp. Tu 3180]